MYLNFITNKKLVLKTLFFLILINMDNYFNLIMVFLLLSKLRWELRNDNK